MILAFGGKNGKWLKNYYPSRIVIGSELKNKFENLFIIYDYADNVGALLCIEYTYYNIYCNYGFNMDTYFDLSTCIMQ